MTAVLAALAVALLVGIVAAALMFPFWAAIKIWRHGR